MTSPQPLKAAIIIISQTAWADPSSDKTTGILEEVFKTSGQLEVAAVNIVPDDPLIIQRTVQQLCDGPRAVNLIVTSGGTGFATADHTPEAIAPLIERHAPGLVHGMLAASLAVTPFAMMSRPLAGTRKATLILTLPGSPKGAKENLEAVIKLLPHACTQAAGADSRTLHQGGLAKLERESGVRNGIPFVSKGPTAAGSASLGHSHTHDHTHSHDHGHGGHHGPRAHTRPEDRPHASNDPDAGPSRRYRESPYPMLSVPDALQLIAEKTPAPKVIKVPVNENLIGHVLAADVKAQESVPAFRASIVDGYAIRIPSSGTFDKGIYPVSQISHAQASESTELKVGTIARITTGAPLPPGADAVIMVEDTVLKSLTDDGHEESEIEILTSEIKSGENVREIGSDVQAGDIILRKGEGISVVGGEFGLLASVGTREVEVYEKPVVGVLSTGDEIIEHSRTGGLKLGEVRDTNRPTLLTSVRSAGFEAIDLGIASDKPGTLESTLRQAMQTCDTIITSGGVSMGELDLLKPTIERSLGGTIHFGRVSMKPGKPTTFATVPIKDPATSHSTRTEKVIFALPGNPASAVVTFQLFVLPSLHSQSGIEPTGLPKVMVCLEDDVKYDAQRAEYHRCIIVARKDGKLYASSTGGQRSSRIGSFKGANGLLCLPAGKEAGRQKAGKGEVVEALLMGKVVSELDLV